MCLLSWCWLPSASPAVYTLSGQPQHPLCLSRARLSSSQAVTQASGRLQRGVWTPRVLRCLLRCWNLCGEGAKELQKTCSPRLTLLQVDITQPQQVHQALLDTKAKLGLRGLWGLVNNAGVCVNFGDAELSLMSNYRGCMEVNFFGTLNVTKTFLPLLRQAKGRIVTISSPAGEQPFPCLAAYGASKAAFNLFINTLRHEMEPWGVKVSTILPSSYKTGQSINQEYWNKVENLRCKGNSLLTQTLYIL